jgi:SET domain-containing protein
MFNHAKKPNVGFIRDIPNAVIRYFTLRDIETGEELCISYGDHLWFEDTDGNLDEEEDISNDEDEWFAKVLIDEEE